MPTRLRKTRERRGSRTCGYGRVGQHRDTGSRPYRKVGFHKHKWSYVTTYEPEYFGKAGFTSPISLGRKVNTINISEVDRMAGQLATAEKGSKPLVDLASLGYTKLLGSGRVTRALSIKVASCSKSAMEKVEKAGGEVLVGAEEKGE